MLNKHYHLGHIRLTIFLKSLILVFIHLRVHSAYSLAEGALPLEEIAELARNNNQAAVAITDTNNMFGALEAAEKLSKVGVQPIIGAQLAIHYQQIVGNMVFIAINRQGYENLMQLTSHIHLNVNEVNGEKCIDFSILKKYSEGLFALSGYSDGLVGKMILLAKDPLNDNGIDSFIKAFTNIFENRFYMEIQRHGLEVEKKIEKHVINLAYKFNIPLVATNDCYFPSPEMYEAHDALICIAAGRYVLEDDRRKLTPHHYFKSSQEMVELFSDLPEAINHTMQIASRCLYFPEPHKPILPPYESANGASEEEALLEQATKGLENRLETEVYPLHPKENHAEIKDAYHNRLLYEIDIIKTMGFPGYFLIVADFIQWAKKQNIPVGPGRGSGAGSLTAWALTITDIDPIRFGLIFERFLNPERVSMPDFDVDFCQDRRDEVIKYVQQKYGADHVAHIITFGKLQARAALRDVGRVLQIPYPVVDRICKLVPNNPGVVVSLKEVVAEEEAIQRQIEEDAAIGKMVEIAIKLEGLYRHASTHAAGVVIGDRPITKLVPVYKDESASLPATQFNMKYTEMAGLVKFDFLGLKTLTIIEHAVKIVCQQQPDFSIHNIPLDDHKTFELLSKIQVVGVFQVESIGMRDVLQKLKPDRFEDIIALVALYRPGPMDDIPRYLSCKHGQEAVTYLHPSLEPILSSTYGVMVYQEQVMKIAQDLAGYSLGAADLLRRAMGKKIKAEMDDQRQRFVDGAIKNNIQKTTANHIFDAMAKFAGYGFNKSHAAPYGLLTYQTAYLKANYPLAFFAAVMTADMHNTDKLNIYFQDIQHMGLCILPPDINFSFSHFEPEGENLRYGLCAIKNVGDNVVEEIVAERNKCGKFKNLDDFVERVGHLLNKRMLEPLIACGALDSLHENRQALFKAVDHLTAPKKEKNSRQIGLFTNDSAIKEKVILPSVTDWNSAERLQKEFESFGFYFSGHPLESYTKHLEKLHISPSTEMETTIKEDFRVAGVVLGVQARTGKSGKKFAFVHASDAFGAFEVAIFSEVYQESLPMLKEGTMVMFQLQVRIRDDQRRTYCTRIDLLENLSFDEEFTLELKNQAYLDELLRTLKNLPNGKACLKLSIPNILENNQVIITVKQKAISPPIFEKLQILCEQ